MSGNAEWWINECGGVFCSKCGLYHDDYFEKIPDICPSCGSLMTEDTKTMVYMDYTLSSDDIDYYLYESEYPEWLLQLRQNYLNDTFDVEIDGKLVTVYTHIKGDKLKPGDMYIVKVVSGWKLEKCFDVKHEPLNCYVISDTPGKLYSYNWWECYKVKDSKTLPRKD